MLLWNKYFWIVDLNCVGHRKPSDFHIYINLIFQRGVNGNFNFINKTCCCSSNELARRSKYADDAQITVSRVCFHDDSCGVQGIWRSNATYNYWLPEFPQLIKKITQIISHYEMITISSFLIVLSIVSYLLTTHTLKNKRNEIIPLVVSIVPTLIATHVLISKNLEHFKF